MLRIVTALGVMVATSSAIAAPHAGGPAILWHGVRIGMTEAQVRGVLPGLEKNDRNNDFHAPATQIAGEPFDVGVQMIAGRVARVSLTSSQALPNEIKQALQAKFGTEIKPYYCRMDAFYRCEGEWRAPGGVTVSLINLTIQGSSSTEVRYEAPDTSGL